MADWIAVSDALGTLCLHSSICPLRWRALGAIAPVILSVSVDPGWSPALETAALFLLGEAIVGQAIEPWLYGKCTGLSPVAVVVSATFWTALWGPVGLLLSNPFTMCLVLLGRHV